MFERFTDRARRIAVLAQEEARQLNHNYIGTEHLLLGMLAEGEGVAAKTLDKFGLTLAQVREKVREKVGEEEAEAPSGHIPFTPRAKRMLEEGLREALLLAHNYIGTEHMLLGLVRLGQGRAVEVLTELGIELPQVRSAVIELLGSYTSPPSPVSPSREVEPECPRCYQTLVDLGFRKISPNDEATLVIVFCPHCGGILHMK